MTHHPGAGVRRKYALEPTTARLGTIGDDDHAGVNRVSYPVAAAMVERDPAGAACRVEHGVEERPVRDRVRSVLHRLGLAVGRRDGPGIQMIAADYDRRADPASSHHPVETLAHLRARAV